MSRERILFAVLAAAVFITLALCWPGRTAAQAPAADTLAAPRTQTERSAKQVRAFRARFPCPATGEARGACPGFVVDHVVPLCAGGPDTPHNMQWQSVADAKAKDRDEHAQCRRMRREGR